MDPLERYTFTEAISGQELKRDPSHTKQIFEPSQGGGGVFSEVFETSPVIVDS